MSNLIETCSSISGIAEVVKLVDAPRSGSDQTIIEAISNQYNRLLLRQLVLFIASITLDYFRLFFNYW